MLERVWRKRNLTTLLAEMKISAVTKNSTEVPRKTKNETTIWSSNPILEHIRRPLYSQQQYSQQPRHWNNLMPSDRQGDKGGVVWICNGVLLGHKKEQNVICSNMDRARDYHTKQSKSERETQIPYDITYMWSLKYNTSEHIKETDSQLQRTSGHQGGGGMGARRTGSSDQQTPTIIYIQNE